MRIIRICTTFALLVFLLSSCSWVSTPPSAPGAQIPWKDRQVALNRIDNWKINGKIAVQTPQDSGSASIDWVQNQQRFNIALMGPLGTNSLKLWGQPGSVTMETSNGKRVTAGSPEQLLREQWGWDLPVSNLSYWVRGIPVPGGDFNGQYDQYHRLTSLVQNGWNVQYLSYMNVGAVDLPNRISISSAKLKTKIVVYQWKVA